MSAGTKPSSDALAYNKNLRAEIETDVNEKPRARVHSVEWRKIMMGEPVEINPSIGHGYKIMTVDEWAGRWKRNDDFPACLGCGCDNTKEHHFTQVKEVLRLSSSVETIIICVAAASENLFFSRLVFP